MAEREQRKEQRGGSDGQQPKAPGSMVSRLIAVVALVGSLAAVVLLYRHTFPQSVPGAEMVESAPGVATDAATTEEVYQGVSDPWTVTGTFTVYDVELDKQIKEFVDTYADEYGTASANARTLYDVIVTYGTYAETAVGEKPTGSDWVPRLARLYFGASDPSLGVTPAVDYYEQAAALSYCLRYLGYTDVVTVPVIISTTWAEHLEGAVCFVFDTTSGTWKVCNPMLGGDGFMTEVGSVYMIVEDVGQDLSQIKALGVEIIAEETDTGSVSADGTIADGATTEGTTADAMAETDATATNDATGYDASGAYDEYGSYEEYGAY